MGNQVFSGDLGLGSDSPFSYLSIESLSWAEQWNDSGTGGNDWSLINPLPPTQTEIRLLGDVIYWGRIGPIVQGTPRQPNASTPSAGGVQYIIVRNDPKYSKPATGFNKITDLVGMGGAIWRPTCDDPNYVALGDIVRKKDVVPNPATELYSLVHKSYVIDGGNTAKQVVSDDSVQLFRTIEGTSLFRASSTQKYTLLNFTQLQACCSGSTQCPARLPGSQFCSAAMTANCSADDIKQLGKCESWCQADSPSCDLIKTKFCSDHPDDPYCDCINATTRADYLAQIKGNEFIYNQSIPACFYPKCKSSYVFTTTDMKTAQLGQRCSKDIDYIDQRINVAGQGNVLNTQQTTQRDSGNTVLPPGTTAPATTSTPDTILGLSTEVFYILVIFVVFVFVILIILLRKSGNEQMQQMQQIPMQYMQQMPMPVR